MIERIEGRLSAIEGQQAVLEPGGMPVAFRLLLPAYLADRLNPRIGESVEFRTLMYLEGQGQGTSFVPRLVGFATSAERSFFELFTTVKGVGSRKALRAMAAEPAVIARAIAGRDAKTLVELPEIGKRLAETIIAELDGKVSKFLSTDELDEALAEAERRPTGGLTGPASEAMSALMALGEAPESAERMVRSAMAIEPKPETTDELIQAAYRIGR
ncbi:MAG: Holliday junction branch migration protein RuvA [Planctomycetota bacterium]